MSEEPTDERVAIAARLGVAACDNALALVEQADLLEDDENDLILEDEGRARAVALTVLAAEELAKAWAASLLVQFGPEEGVWEEFKRIIRGRHEAKIGSMLFLEQFLPRLSGKQLDGMGQELKGLLASDLYEKKNRALYVDLADDGSILGPKDIASDTDAQGKARTLRKSITAWGVILAGTLQPLTGEPPPPDWDEDE